MNVVNLSSTPHLENLLALYRLAQDPAKTKCPELPTLPPRAKGYPTPCLTRPEIQELLIPVVEHGWTVEFKLPEDKTTQSENDEPDCGCGHSSADTPHVRELPFLVRRYRFNSPTGIQEYLSDVRNISNIGENHHYDSYTITSNELALFVQTHSAKKPRHFVGGSTTEWVPTVGITVRDIRYAILLEHLYRLQDTNAVTDPPHTPYTDQLMIDRLLGTP
ncbi:hypothetical protein FA15DRAFT_696071 [Coprinopsis marcescibilis]|uniref:Uncharacterized protein n=1 Tax=Coprinopsis marcescibilis TaxID=230819 RepID=A0A5C3KP67_COPMA|nr:hypothetical protein FA15DRAFT_696071 [Coprinopsis marcescibilis]